MSAAPPEAWDPLLRAARFARRPLERFLRVEAASGILLLVAAAIALAWANSPWAGAYSSLWHTPLGVRIGAFAFERSLEWFVNDVLMVIFFFVVGLEIRREIHVGELSEWRRAALPAAAALGGMLAPAALYLLVRGRVGDSFRVGRADGHGHCLRGRHSRACSVSAYRQRCACCCLRLPSSMTSVPSW